MPLVKEVIARFALARAASGAVFAKLEHLEGQRSRANTQELARPLREQREALGEQGERIRAIVRELLDLGIEIKHLDPVLLDFPALRDDRIVYLCWQEGEEQIAYWHDLDAGFVGRQPL